MDSFRSTGLRHTLAWIAALGLLACQPRPLTDVAVTPACSQLEQSLSNTRSDSALNAEWDISVPSEWTVHTKDMPEVETWSGPTPSGSWGNLTLFVDSASRLSAGPVDSTMVICSLGLVSPGNKIVLYTISQHGTTMFGSRIHWPKRGVLQTLATTDADRSWLIAHTLASHPD
jgi:hypothetical protein